MPLLLQDQARLSTLYYATDNQIILINEKDVALSIFDLSTTADQSEV